MTKKTNTTKSVQGDILYPFYSSFSPFSNWHKKCYGDKNYQFQIESVKYNCSEQYMMAMKAKTFKDEKKYDEIMKSSSPKEQKKLGRQVKNFDANKWSDKCVKIMTDGLLAKFMQNVPLRKLLLSTKNSILVEASPYDTIWGIGMSSDNPDFLDTTKWKGSNLLGKVLMEVRKKILESELESES